MGMVAPTTTSLARKSTSLAPARNPLTDPLRERRLVRPYVICGSFVTDYSVMHLSWLEQLIRSAILTIVLAVIISILAQFRIRSSGLSRFL
jgi:hypothetical protein